MRRCVIIGGANINNYPYIKSKLREDDFFIFCDSGLRHAKPLGIKPSLITGDFDSYPKPETDVETIVLPCQKADTDTVFATKEAIRRGYEDFLLIGVIGERLDHTLGNISILMMLDSAGKKAKIIDHYSEMEIVSGTAPVPVHDSFSYFSLLNISGIARGITIEGAEYPLRNAEITTDYPYGISNRVLPGQTAVITVAEGRLLLICIF